MRETEFPEFRSATDTSCHRSRDAFEKMQPQVGFGTFELDLGSGELRRAGLRVRLAPQPGRLLAALLRHPGEVVTREELRRELWSDGTHVDFDRSLNFCVNQLRQCLGDTARTPRFIETVPRVGYRFLAPVRHLGPQPWAALDLRPRHASWSRWLAAGLAMTWLVTHAGGPPLTAQPPGEGPPLSVPDGYLRGLDLSRQGPSQWTRAAERLEGAVLKDPAFAPAQAALADVYLRLASQRLRPAHEVLPLAGVAARAALEADGANAEAHLWAGMVALHGDWDWPTARREIQEAISLDPDLAVARRAHAVYLSAQGDDTGALREIEAARRLDPLCPVVTGEAAWYRARAGLLDEAATLWQAASAVREDVGSHESLLLLYQRQGRQVNAAEEAVRAMRVAGVPEPSVLDMSGRAPQAIVQIYLRGAIEWLQTREPGTTPPERLAILHAALGETEAALAQLARACDERSFDLPRALRDPAFDPLRTDPRFRRFVARVGVAS